MGKEKNLFIDWLKQYFRLNLFLILFYLFLNFCVCFIKWEIRLLGSEIVSSVPDWALIRVLILGFILLQFIFMMFALGGVKGIL